MYAVLTLDSYTVRNHFKYCTLSGVGAPRVYKDAFDALKYLHGFAEIDRNRIYLVGFSLGSFTAAVVSSKSVAERLGSQYRFKASVGWYGTCLWNPGGFFPKWELIREDADMPVLLLMGGRDTETPVGQCESSMARLKEKGYPVNWHVYPDATHGWDKNNSARGYSFSVDTTKDAMNRTRAFLEENR